MSVIEIKKCSKCGNETKNYKNPIPTVDLIITSNDQIVLINRLNEPFGLALPGGFVDYGESIEHAAVREAKEETNLDIVDLQLFGVYSDPDRDPRQHNISITYIGIPHDITKIKAGDDAGDITWYHISEIPWDKLVFDHARIIKDYLNTL